MNVWTPIVAKRKGPVRMNFNGVAVLQQVASLRLGSDANVIDECPVGGLSVPDIDVADCLIVDDDVNLAMMARDDVDRVVMDKEAAPPVRVMRHEASLNYTCLDCGSRPILTVSLSQMGTSTERDCQQNSPTRAAVGSWIEIRTLILFPEAAVTLEQTPIRMFPALTCFLSGLIDQWGRHGVALAHHCRPTRGGTDEDAGPRG